MVLDAVRQITQIGHHADLYALGLKGKSAGISRVMRDSERRYGDVGYFKAAADLKVFAALQLGRLAFRVFR